MKDKNLPPDNNMQSLEDLTEEANNIIDALEREKDLRNSIDTYQELLRLNNIIEKKFQKDICISCNFVKYIFHFFLIISSTLFFTSSFILLKFL